MGDGIFVSRIEGDKLIVETADGIEEYDARFIVAAVLVYIARSSGQIEPEESTRMIALLDDHFKIQSSQSLELITRAMSELVEKPELGDQLVELASAFSDTEKEAIAIMSLKVIAADGRREIEEMEGFSRVMQALKIAPETVYKAFEQYFSKNMPGS
jgi:uncharacterized tellurite resistance protein B-like protein